jgi:hypothetical protein
MQYTQVGCTSCTVVGWLNLRGGVLQRIHRRTTNRPNAAFTNRPYRQVSIKESLDAKVWEGVRNRCVLVGKEGGRRAERAVLSVPCRAATAG